MKWQTHEKRELALRWGSGQTSATIASALTRPRHAVMGQIDRMQLMHKKGDAAAALEAIHRLNHPKPSDGHPPATQEWTKADDEGLALRWSLGLPPHRIGIALRPTRDAEAVIRRAHRLKIAQKPPDHDGIDKDPIQPGTTFRDDPLMRRILATAPPIGSPWPSAEIDDFCTMIKVAMSRIWPKDIQPAKS